jgi:hypothetical protein
MKNGVGQQYNKSSSQEFCVFEVNGHAQRAGEAGTANAS